MKRQIAFLFFIMIQLSACSMFHWNDSAEKKAAANREQVSMLENAKTLFDQTHYADAEAAYMVMLSKYPSGEYSQSARMGLASVEEARGEFQKAIEIYREVVDLNKVYNPAVSTLALFRLAYCYEVTAQDLLNLAALKDVERRSDLLPDEIRLAELPARLATAHMRLSDLETAQSYLKKASEGLYEIKVKKLVTKKTMAEIYYYMGRMGSHEIHNADFSKAVAALKSVEPFAIKAIEQEEAPWSDLALKGIQANYQDLWGIILKGSSADENLDAISLKRKNHDDQIELANVFAELFLEANKYRETEPKGQLSAYFQMVDIYQNKIHELVLRAPEYNPLTPEWHERQTLRVKGQIRVTDHSKDLLPEEKIIDQKLPSKKIKSDSAPVESRDPNL